MIFQVKRGVIFLLMIPLFSLNCTDGVIKEKAMKEDDILNEFPSEAYEKVVAYKMNGMYAEVIE